MLSRLGCPVRSCLTGIPRVEPFPPLRLPKFEDLTAVIFALRPLRSNRFAWTWTMLWGIALCPQVAPADAAAPADGSTLEVEPAVVELAGRDSRQQLLVSKQLPTGERRDVAREARYAVANSKIARVSAEGVVEPLASGSTQIVVTNGSDQATVQVHVAHGEQFLPLDFRQDILPILTKAGCNGGGCHGKSDGRGGFQLSLFGFDPTNDYDSVVKKSRGRRLSLASPETSLLLLKPTAVLPHGGGRRLSPDQPEYERLRRWIADGAPREAGNMPTLVRLEARPSVPVLAHDQQQQLAVTASYSDGTRQDVTRLTEFRSNETSIATVDDQGLVTSGDRTGETAVVCMYRGQTSVARIMLPLANPKEAWPGFAKSNFIDRHIAAKLKELRVAPSPVVEDGGFLRRVSLQLAGRLPTVTEVRAFLANRSPDKRAAAVDRLLASGQHADYFAQKWADVLRNKRRGQEPRLPGTMGFYQWIRSAIADRMPYDQFVRSVITASGHQAVNAPAQWYAEVRYLDRYVDDTAQVFLGVRIGCARCHNHPFEKFTQQDYYGLAAFFARVGRKGGNKGVEERRANETIFVKARGQVNHPVTGEIVPPHGLGGPELSIAPYDDPRQHLVDWMTSPDNPYFARAFVNRMWAHFFGRGLVEPLDDQRATNPAINEPLLAELADEFVRSGYDMRCIPRLICTSTTYQLSSLPNADNLDETQCHSRFYPQRMTAEVLLDAIDNVTRNTTRYGNLPEGTRAVQLPDEDFSNQFLTLFGRPPRESACECERVAQPSLSQAVFLMNDSFFVNKLFASGSMPDDFVRRDNRPNREKIQEMFLAALAREPRPEELKQAEEYIRSESSRLTAYRNLLWALLNTKEFLYVH
jgi:hypothetical protein